MSFCNDIIYTLADFLDARDLCRFAQTNKHNYMTIKNNKSASLIINNSKSALAKKQAKLDLIAKLTLSDVVIKCCEIAQQFSIYDIVMLPPSLMTELKVLRETKLTYSKRNIPVQKFEQVKGKIDVMMMKEVIVPYYKQHLDELRNVYVIRLREIMTFLKIKGRGYITKKLDMMDVIEKELKNNK